MKKFRLFKVLSMFAIAAAGAVAVGVGAKAPKVEAAEAAAGDKELIFLTNNYAWSDLKVHYSSPTAGATTWPGQSMTWLVKNNSNQDVYYFALPKDASVIVFTGYDNGNFKQSVDLTPSLSTSNAWYFTGWDGSGKATFGTWNVAGPGVRSGETVYVNYNSVSFWEPGCIPCMYFFDEVSGESAAWSTGHVVHGTNDKLIEFVVPGTSCNFRSGTAVRCKTANSWTGAYNQTVDFDFAACVVNKASNLVRNSLVIQNSKDSSGHYYIDWDNSYNLSDDARAKFYGTYFLQQVTCDGDGSVTAGNNAWTNVSNEYSSMSSSIQGIVWTQEGVEEGSTDLETAMYRYDYIVFFKKNLDPSTYAPYTDFIGRANSGSGKTSFSTPLNISNLLGNNADATIAIVIISVASVSALAGFLLIRKRKHI